MLDCEPLVQDRGLRGATGGPASAGCREAAEAWAGFVGMAACEGAGALSWAL